MTKQETIQKAYGKHWNVSKDFVDENGLFLTVEEDDFLDLSETKQWEKVRTNRWRPKSLRGIENNNGWTNIYTEADLPKIKGDYWCVDRLTGEDEFTQEHYDPDALISLNVRWMYRIVSYQLIVKPLKRIY